MKSKFMKIVKGKAGNNGLCRVCHYWFKKDEKFILFNLADSRGKVFEYKLCLNCLLEFILSGWELDSLVKRIYKSVENNI